MQTTDLKKKSHFYGLEASLRSTAQFLQCKLSLFSCQLESEEGMVSYLLSTLEHRAFTNLSIDL